jgi:NAD-dependent deacetylase
MDEIAGALDRCGLLLVVGTSGVVHPAASFVALARSRNARTVYVGPDEPANAASFDDLRLAPAGLALPLLVDEWLGGPGGPAAPPC